MSQPTGSGVTVTDQTALRVTAFLSCVRVLAESISTLPLTAKAARERDPRLPPAGTEIVRPYEGRRIRVTVLAEGLRWLGEACRSLTALAGKITGARAINGPLWFRLRDRERAEAKVDAPTATRGKKAAAPADAPATTDDVARAE